MEQIEHYCYKLTIEYDGTNYCGFQQQNLANFKSIEGQLLVAIKKFTNNDVDIAVSGRTDAGVHAINQIISFKLAKKISQHQMIMGLNFYLQDEKIAVKNSEIVSSNFNARFNAKMRSYRYIILNRKAVPTIDKNRVWHVGGKKLNIDAMNIAKNYLLGEHDFSSFRDAECQGKSPIKTISSITIYEQDNEKIIIEISAKSFLHHMVRNIVGTLVWVGQEKITADYIQNILLAKDRKASGPNAPACGLYFLDTIY
jgi:tRNA pseudouridine38-40 synthase